MMIRQTIALMLVFLSCAAGGCGGARQKPANRPNVHPVQGKIFIDGQPPVGAVVMLYETAHPALAKFRPHATVDANGAFRLTTFATDDGAADGSYAMTVVWPGAPPRGETDVDGPDRLKGVYAKPTAPAARVDIGPDTTELPTVELQTTP